ncbi:MAG: DNA-3-methyladenine glycosylase I [Gammaproteobacteria bacterium]
MTSPDRSPAFTRCGWSNADPLYLDYHDKEWGVPVHDDRTQFEFLVLEGAQAGLSWMTVLRKRAGYRRAFDDFDAEKVARYGEREIEALCNDPGIIRNRKKIESAVLNAQAFLAIQEAFGSFDVYIWHFVDGKPKPNAWRTVTELPAKSPESEALSRDLKQRGFRFVGPTICYAHMQATGLVNDHIVDCFRYAELLAGR